MWLTLVLVIASAWAIVELAGAFKRRQFAHPTESSPHAKQLRRQTYPSGVTAGVLSCIFGILGIYTYGLAFAPLAAMCGVFGLLHAISSSSIAGLALSACGAVLAVTAGVSSPSLAAAVHPYITRAIAQTQELAAYVLTQLQQ